MNHGIEITAMGKIDNVLVEEVARHASETFSESVSIGERRRRVHESAYDPARDQYFAPMLLRSLDGRGEGPGKVLCLTDLDIFLPGLNYIFGLSDELRSVAIVSVTRLKRKDDEGKKEKEIERAVKTAVHELGHLYGLSHCHDGRCVMFFSYNLSDTDHKGKDFCTRCGKRLSSLLALRDG